MENSTPIYAIMVEGNKGPSKMYTDKEQALNECKRLANQE